MTRVALIAAVAIAPLFVIVFTAIRALCLFSSVRRLFDGGERAVAPVMNRVVLSIGSPSVSLVLNLDDLPRGHSTVSVVKQYLAQQYRKFEVVLVCPSGTVPTELVLAFDLTETGSSANGTMYQSRRDNRLRCMVTEGIKTESGFWRVAIAAASRELILPIDPRWDLGLTAIAEMASPWVRRPRTDVSIALVHPKTAGPWSSVGLVAARTDLMAVAGLGTGGIALGALGALGSGYEGCIAGMFSRSALRRIDGLPGPINDPATWTEVGRRLDIDGRNRTSESRVQVVPRPIGHVNSSGRREIVESMTLAGLSWSTRSLQLLYHASSFMPLLVVLSIVAAILGRVTGFVPADLLWIAASTPILSAVVVVLGLMMDDRAVHSAGATRARLSLLFGAVGASLWGALGSPLRWPAGEFNRA